MGGCLVPETYLREVVRGQAGYLGEKQKGIALITPAEFPIAPAFGFIEQRHQPHDFGLDIG
ncbi:hypothetical protein ADK97_34315 [Streptomyces sp. H021]|nr:hypothetical protein ADK97_34315 [Streptomyces sp. H021]